MSENLNLKNAKTIWGIKLIFCLHWSYKKYAILNYVHKRLLASQFAGRFNFDLFDLLILIPGLHCYVVLVKVVVKVYLHEGCDIGLLFMLCLRVSTPRRYFVIVYHVVRKNGWEGWKNKNRVVLNVHDFTCCHDQWIFVFFLWFVNLLWAKCYLLDCILKY